MISYIRGEVLFRTDSSVVIDVGGIGYEVFVPYNVMCAIERTSGPVELFTYLQVKEDGLSLYGFAAKQDLATFKLLISVSGVGPKLAVGIMSFMTTEDLMLAVLAEDAKAIAKAPGLGAKTAAKIVLELKDKFRIEDTLTGYEVGSMTGVGSSAGRTKDSADKAEKSGNSQTTEATGEVSDRAALQSMKNEAVQALIALGYSSSQALKAVRSIPDADDLTVEKLLKASLKYM